MLRSLYRFLHPRFQSISLDYKVDMRPRYGHGRPAHPELDTIIGAHRDQYRELIDAALALKEHIWEIQPSMVEKDETKPAWNNGFLPGLDIVGIYAMLTKYRPARYVEVGSGNSTKVAYKARKDQNLEMKITSIDPYPRAEIDALVDEVVRQPFENVDLDFLSDLDEGDVLFIDNSHIILPNSDAMVFFMEVMPRLRKGVIVHVHDVYLPYDYPQFMCDRAYSEQYGLAMYLLANPDKYHTLLPNYYISEDSELSERIAPMWEHPHLKGVETHGGSFWFRIME